MMSACLIIVFILAWSLGKNNLSNLFGVAISTKMIPLKAAKWLAVIGIIIGAVISGNGTTNSVLSMAELKTPLDIMIVFISAFLIMEALSFLGIPASIVQTIIGALIGWNLFYQSNVDWKLVRQMITAWFFAPMIACFICLIGMKKLRFFLNKHPLSIFKRDIIVRIGLIGVGILASYTLGANNISTISAPFLTVFKYYSAPCLIITIATAVGIGCLTADIKVINTVGKRLFPLSPTESFMVMLATSLTLILFSMSSLRTFLIWCHFPSFPLVPIPMSSVMIGAICGISLAKGGNGLHFSVLMRIITSWVIVPMLSALISILFLTMCGDMT